MSGNTKTPEDVRRVTAETRKTGDAGSSESSAATSGHNATLDGYAGPRIVINPTTFHNSKDGLCVAWNEAIRVFMEANGYEPQSEPTEAQRRFFADTPYADDELQLRRTILARICTFDTSVKDPTDDQLTESASILRSIVESGFAKTDDEVNKCERLARAVEAAVGAEPLEPPPEPLEPASPEPLQTRADFDGGKKDEDKGQEVQFQTDGDTSIATDENGNYLGDAMDTPQENLPPEQQTDGQQGSAAEGAPQQEIGEQPQQETGEQPQQETGEQPQQETGGRQVTPLASGIDRSQFGKNGHIGIGARIVDPETGKSVSALSARGMELSGGAPKGTLVGGVPKGSRSLVRRERSSQDDVSAGPLPDQTAAAEEPVNPMSAPAGIKPLVSSDIHSMKGNDHLLAHRRKKNEPSA